MGLVRQTSTHSGGGYSGNPVSHHESFRALNSLLTWEIASWLTRVLVCQKHSPSARLDFHECRSYQSETY